VETIFVVMARVDANSDPEPEVAYRDRKAAVAYIEDQFTETDLEFIDVADFYVIEEVELK
jgi:hypothetical protein